MLEYSLDETQEPMPALEWGCIKWLFAVMGFQGCVGCLRTATLSGVPILAYRVQLALQLRSRQEETW